MAITPFDLMTRLIGTKEIPGSQDNSFIKWCLELDGVGEIHDEIPNCSAVLNRICWLLRLPRSKSLAARSWLAVGRPVALLDAVAGVDVVVLWRGTPPQPGAEILAAPGHVGLFAGYEPNFARVQILGANQGDQISVAPFKIDRILGIRRLAG